MMRQAQPLRLTPLQRMMLQEMGVEAALLRPYVLAAAPVLKAQTQPVAQAAPLAAPAPAPLVDGITPRGAPTRAAQNLIEGLRGARATPAAPKPATPPSETPPAVARAASAGDLAPLARASKLVCQCYAVPGQASWLVVGEAPRAADAPAALAQGRAAQLLDAMLAAVRLQPLAAAQAWTNALAPAACVLALGRVAAAAVLGTSDTLDGLRGQVWSCTDATGRVIPVVVTYPPGWLLSHARDKAAVWRDLLLAQAAAQASDA